MILDQVLAMVAARPYMPSRREQFRRIAKGPRLGKLWCHFKTRFLQLAVTVAALAGFSLQASAAEIDDVKTPVPQVLSGRMTVQTAAGQGELPIEVSRDWRQPQPDVTRAVIIIHGWPRRDIGAAHYLAQHEPQASAQTIFITPQFLIAADVDAFHLPAATLRWSMTGWRQGYAAQGPAAISSFDAIDAIFAQLADRSRFPHLQTVVLAGHSAGAQFVQRYAVLGHGEQGLVSEQIHLRYVLANPASYLYFDDRRMQADGSFATVDEKMCPGFQRWNLGFASGLPPYATQPVVAADLEKTYLSKDVVYLLGTADTDPHADALGQSCAYKIQGATRYARGHAYLKYLDVLAPDAPAHIAREVPNVSHHADAMYGSTCGLAALLDKAGCQ